jgi:serine/threonine-protein kinase
VTPARWAEVARVFGLAIEASPAERRAVVEAHSGGDSELCREVMELLAADEQSSDVLLGLSAVVRDALAEAVPKSSEGMRLSLNVGDVVQERYRVERILGAGGMGVVVEATHIGLNERVAMKLLRREIVASPRLRERFLREARAVASVKNRHIVRMRDVGIAENGAPYMVMDLLTGVDLATLLAERKKLPPVEVAMLALQVCEALAVAHAGGLVHRDIKPANLFLERDSTGATSVKLLDFGVSKQASGFETLTRTGDRVGSPAYMSPEQLSSSRDADARCDIWSLGVVLYELACGHRPFQEDTDANLYMSVMQGEPAAITEPSLPPELGTAIHRCLQKDPDSRYGSVAELAVQLAPVVGSAGYAQAARVARASGVYVPLLVEAPTPRRRRVALVLALILVVLGVLLGGLALAGLATRTDPSAVPEPASVAASSDPPAVTLEPLAMPPPSTRPPAASTTAPAVRRVDPSPPASTASPRSSIDPYGSRL